MATQWTRDSGTVLEENEGFLVDESGNYLIDESGFFLIDTVSSDGEQPLTTWEAA